MGSIIFFTLALLLLGNQYVFANPTPQPPSPRTTVTTSEEKNTQAEQNNQAEQDKPNKKSPEQEESSSSLDFSHTGRPGQQTAGESRGICPNLDDKISAVVPASHSGKTVSTHPSFWVYFPDTAQNISHVEFVLQNEEREDVWRSQSKINQDFSPGYKQFSLPATTSGLETGQWYRWYVKLYCQPDIASTQYVQSWVKRVHKASGLYLELQEGAKASHKIYSNHEIWYDAIDQLLEEYQRQPSNLALEQDWQNLIRAKGVKLHSLPNVGTIYEAVK